MPTYIAIVDFTEQGIRAVQDSPGRADAFRDAAASAGATVKDMYWTSGAHDGLLIVDAPDDATAASLFLSLGKAGNVRTQTMRAFTEQEFHDLVASLP